MREKDQWTVIPIDMERAIVTTNPIRIFAKFILSSFDT